MSVTHSLVGVPASGARLHYTEVKGTSADGKRSQAMSQVPEGEAEAEEDEVYIMLRGRYKIGRRCTAAEEYAIVVTYDDAVYEPSKRRPAGSGTARLLASQGEELCQGRRSSIVGEGLSEYRDLAKAAWEAMCGGEKEYGGLEPIREWARRAGFEPKKRITGEVMAYDIKEEKETMDDWVTRPGAGPFYAIHTMLQGHFDFLGKLEDVQVLLSFAADVKEGQSLHWDSLTDQVIVVLHLNRGVATFCKEGSMRPLGESLTTLDPAAAAEAEETAGGEEWVLGTADASARIDAVQRAFLEELEGTEAEQRAQTRYAVAFLEACLREAGLYASEEMLEEVATAAGGPTWLREYHSPCFGGGDFSDPGRVLEAGDFSLLRAMWPHGGPGSRGVSGEGTAEGWVKDEPRAVVYMRYNRKGAAEASKERNTTANSWRMEDVAQWVQRHRGGS